MCCSEKWLLQQSALNSMVRILLDMLKMPRLLQAGSPQQEHMLNISLNCSSVVQSQSRGKYVTCLIFDGEVDEVGVHQDLVGRAKL